MTFAPYGAHVWTKANVALFMITICVFIPPYSQRVTSSSTTTTNANSSILTVKPLNNSIQSDAGPEGFLENGELLIDPSYPISGSSLSNETQVLKPSKIVSNSLLTAATPLPTGPHDYSFDSHLNNHTSYDGNHTQNLPLLSGSLTIALPTPAPHPTMNVATNASISLSRLSPNTVVGFITPDENIPSTPATSTQFVYPTNTPLTSNQASNSMNSAGCHDISTSSYRIASSVSLFLFIVIIA